MLSGQEWGLLVWINCSLWQVPTDGCGCSQPSSHPLLPNSSTPWAKVDSFLGLWFGLGLRKLHILHNVWIFATAQYMHEYMSSYTLFLTTVHFSVEGFFSILKDYSYFFILFLVATCFYTSPGFRVRVGFGFAGRLWKPETADADWQQHLRCPGADPQGLKLAALESPLCLSGCWCIPSRMGGAGPL